MTLDPQRFREAGQAALHDPSLRIALSRLKTHFALNRTLAVERYAGDWETLREQGRAIRDYAVTHFDTLLDQFEQNVIAHGGKVHWARDAAEARGLILGILQASGARAVTKGKSMVSEEIELNPFLEA